MAIKSTSTQKFGLLFFAIVLSMASCGKQATSQKEMVSEKTDLSTPEKIDFQQLPTYFQDSILQAVIEIPAGTNHKIKYRKNTRSFVVDSLDGRERIINFLPYPGNYGFIPSTFSDAKNGDDSGALDILVLAESKPTGSVQHVLPIGMIRLYDAGKSNFKIIAVPADSTQRILNVENFDELVTKHPEVRRMLNDWFSNYDSQGQIRIESWGGEDAANAEIKKHQKT